MSGDIVAVRLKQLEDRIRDLERQETPSAVYLTARLTSTSWDGDSFSTTAKTLIDLSAVFGVPAGVRWVLVGVAFRDSGAAGTDCFLLLAPTDTAGLGIEFTAPPVNDTWGRYSAVVPCDANGDIYYQIVASGSGTMDVWVTIWGYGW